MLSSTVRGNLARLAGLAVLLLASGLAGCQAFWIEPPTERRAQPQSTGTPAANARPPIIWRQPTRVPTPTPEPVIQEDLANRIDLASDDVQYWSNPNSIHDLLFDGEDLWAATYGGLVRWSTLDEPIMYTVREGLASQAVSALALDSIGRLWLGYADVDGWTVFDDGTWHTYGTRRQAVEAAYDTLLNPQRTHSQLWSTRPEGTWIWLPRGDGSVQAYDGARWRVYGVQEGVTPDSEQVGVSPDGQVWAVGEGISTTSEGELWWDDHTFFSEIESPDDVRQIAVDPTGSVWLAFAGDAGGGLARYNRDADRWEGHLAEINLAIPERVHAIEILADGTLWLAGEGRLSVQQPYRQFQTHDLGEITALSFARNDDDHVWLGSDNGLYRLDLQTSAIEGPWTIPSPLPDNHITGLAIDGSGIVYVGTPRGISWIDDEGHTDLLTEMGVTWLGTAPDGTLWAGTAQGLMRHSGEGAFIAEYEGAPVIAAAFTQQGEPYVLTAQGLLLQIGRDGPLERADIIGWTGSMPRDLVVDSSGTVWLATAEGLAELRPDGERALYTEEDAGPLSRDLRAVALDVDDILWMATARGLARLRPDGRWTRFTTESTGGGLRSMDMRHLSVGPLGDLWMATRSGISRRQPEEAEWSYIDVPGARHVLADGTGTLWVATGAGLYRIPVDRLAKPE